MILVKFEKCPRFDDRTIAYAARWVSAIPYHSYPKLLKTPEALALIFHPG